jgi:MYXO-CTERM domain-containing protein
MRCWLSTGSGFGAPIEGPKWSDASGWGFVGYWSTIRLADVDVDGRADLCARAAKGLICHLSEGAAFGAEIAGPTWSDDSGWSRHRYYSTLRLADVDADGDLDACARAAKGIVCAPWENGGFGASFDGPALSDADGWSALRFYQTIRFVDVDGDRRADLCARASAGLSCWPSTGTAFGVPITGPEWSDAKGWDVPRYFSTVRAAGPRCIATEICGNASDDDCNGEIDDGCSAGSGGAGGVSGTSGTAGASGASSGGDGGSSLPGSGGSSPADDGEGASEGGCACGVAGGRERSTLPYLALLLLALGLRRRRC